MTVDVDTAVRKRVPFEEAPSTRRSAGEGRTTPARQATRATEAMAGTAAVGP